MSLASAACVPDVDTDDSLVSGPTVLAVQAEPAEVAEGKPVTYRALFVNGAGATPSATLNWFHCDARKPSAELGPVSQECFQGDSENLQRIGRGAEVKGTMPRTACSLFGPNPPLIGGAEGPPGRPADPDGTGGYKQPVVLGTKDDQGASHTVLYEQRIHCGLAGVDPPTSLEYNNRYRDNVNPSIVTIEVERENGEKLSLAADATLEVNAGENVEFSVVWPTCPEVDVCGDGVCGVNELRKNCETDCSKIPEGGCAGQEDYLWFDVRSGGFDVRRESMSIAWFKTKGTFVDERTGVPEGERADRSANEWTAPSQAGEVKLWTVLRDSRGGVGFRELRVNVR